MTNKIIMISAGEVSGDVHGARLVTELKKIDSSLQFFGMGSERMAKAGVQLFADLTTSSTIGFFEPLKYIPRIYFTYLKMKRLMEKQRPALLIVIDYQGYHMVLIKAAKKLGIPVVYYIAPQEWQWGTEAGGQQVVRYTDKILSIFTEEAAFYQRLGGNAVYIGHPILDLAVATKKPADFLAENNLSAQQPLLTIFPGSRPQELTLTYPMLLAAAKLIRQKIPNVQIVISVASTKFAAQIKAQAQAAGLDNVIFYQGSSYDLIAATTLSLVTSGTITLEHACLGTPCLVNYRFGNISYWVVKTIFAEKVNKIKYMALPNLIMDRIIQPEFFQAACQPQSIAKKAIELLTNPAAYQQMKADLVTVRQKMGMPGVITRAAQEIIKMVHK